MLDLFGGSQSYLIGQELVFRFGFWEFSSCEIQKIILGGCPKIQPMQPQTEQKETQKTGILKCYERIFSFCLVQI